MLLGSMVLFICSLGVARGYEAALYLARSRLEDWLAIIDDLSRAADENVDTGHSLEQAFMHMMKFLPGLLGLEIVFKGGSLLLGKAEGHREVLRAEDGREVVLYVLEANLMASEKMRTIGLWLSNRLWDVAMKLELRGQASLDPLSGLLNRRAYEARLPGVLHLAQVQQRPLAILMIDLDHFKRINDTCGHAVGDQVIQAVAQTMRAFYRAEDLLIRWGGEEFLVIMVGADRNQAVVRAELLSEAIGTIAVSNVPWSISAYIGVAGGAVPQNEAQFERWLQEADEAAYAAKRAGRNMVVLSQASDAA
jgi:diguanylate cyclase (GGDEF)-like protein